MFTEYGVGFEFMFGFVESLFEQNPDDKNVQIIYHEFFEIRKELQQNGNKG